MRCLRTTPMLTDGTDLAAVVNDPVVARDYQPFPAGDLGYPVSIQNVGAGDRAWGALTFVSIDVEANLRRPEVHAAARCASS
jgi:hypothetical protein